jgi:hypothetical protein
MIGRRFSRFTCAVLCAVPLVSAQTVARADVIGAEEFINVTDRREALGRIEAVLARAEVRQELERLGVDPEQASARVAALNDQELQLLAQQFDDLPAGGSLLGIVGIVFIVLLILELVGVINIFNKI